MLLSLYLMRDLEIVCLIIICMVSLTRSWNTYKSILDSYIGHFNEVVLNVAGLLHDLIIVTTSSKSQT